MSELASEHITPLIRYEQNMEGESEFSFPFPITEAKALKIAINDQIMDDKDYEINGIGHQAGGKVHFAHPPALGDIVTLWRQTEPIRTISFIEGGTIHANGLNQALDRLTLLQQDMMLLLSQCLRYAQYPSTPDCLLPQPDSGKALIWNEAGNGLTNAAFDFGSMVDKLLNLDETLLQTSEQAQIAVTAADNAEQAANVAKDAANKAELSAISLTHSIYGFYHEDDRLYLEYGLENYELSHYASSLLSVGGMEFTLQPNGHLMANLQE